MTSMSWAELEEALRRRGRLLPPRPAATDDGPWYVQVLLGVGVWVGAALIALVLAITLLKDLSAAPLPVGVFFFIVAVLVSRLFTHLVAGQLTLIASFVAQIGISVDFPGGDRAIPAVIIVVQTLAIVAIRSRLHRFLSVVAIGVATAGAVEGRLWPTGSGLVVTALALAGATAVFGLGYATGHRASRNWARPLGYGALVILIGQVASFAVSKELTGVRTFGEPLRGGQFGELVGMAATLALFVVMAAAARRLGQPIKSRAVVGGSALVLLLAVVTRLDPGLLVAVLVLVLAHASRRPAVHVLGVLGVVGALFGYYYSLDVPLLWKSLVVVSTGAVLLVARPFALRFFAASVLPDGPSSLPSGAEVAPSKLRARLSKDAALLGAGALVAVVGVVGLSAQKEVLLRTGEVAYLELAPRDPRSLLQGDYMELRYRLVVDAEGEVRRSPGPSRHRGELVARRDEEAVLHFVRLDDGSALEADERNLEWASRGRSVAIGPAQFFFQEGEGPKYARARFAEVRITGDGRVLLVTLLDANKAPL